MDSVLFSQPQPKAKRPLLFSDEKPAPATRPRMTLTAIAMANPTPAAPQEARRAAPNTAITSTADREEEEEGEDPRLAVPRRLFSEATAVAGAIGDRGASSSPPRFKATRALFPGSASPGRWLDSIEKQPSYSRRPPWDVRASPARRCVIAMFPPRK